MMYLPPAESATPPRIAFISRHELNEFEMTLAALGRRSREYQIALIPCADPSADFLDCVTVTNKVNRSQRQYSRSNWVAEFSADAQDGMI